jgi:alginate O-acetyltransferase complex protein AlgI
MDSASWRFVLFGLCAALVSNFSRSRGWRSAALLLASIVFLAILARNPLVLLPLAGFLLLGYIGLALIQGAWGKSATWGIIAVIFAYVWLKKYTFLPSSLFIHRPYFTLGLSYIFFRVLHLLIEAGDGHEKRHVGLGAYLLYTLNFTTFISGPIQRYDEFADQFGAEPLALGPQVIGLQLERIVRGFFKVNVLAMLFDIVHADALSQISQPLPIELKLFVGFKLAIAYPFFLYSNFSGYIDIVIGVARLMRLRLPENFDRPFSATSFLDFWNRWHITLSTWLKTYVYNPLLMALMRRTPTLSLQPYLAVLCFFVTFFLIGIWHGRTSEFALFGVLQGGGAAVNKLWQIGISRVLGRKGYKELSGDPLYEAFGRGLTFSWFAFSLFWFWGTWKQIDQAFSALNLFQWLGVWLAIWMSATLTLALWEVLRASLLSVKALGGPVATSRYARVVYASAMGLVAVVVTVLLSQPAPGIVYKAF